jgi:replicative DNA helicase
VSEPIAPQNLEAEEFVLGAIMLAPKVITTMREAGLEASVFYRASHGRIFEAALALDERGEPVEPITVVAELERRGQLEDAGGKTRLYEIANIVPAASNALHYARLVLEAARRRRLDHIGLELRQAALNGGRISADLRERIAETLRVLEPGSLEVKRLVPGDEFILDGPAEVVPVWGGASGSVVWAQGEGLTLVGPDGVGKTSLAQQVALGLIGLRRRVLGMRLAESEGSVLYLALDRPAQARRSFARMVDESSREILRERLSVWYGPPPFSVLEDPRSLARFARDHGAAYLFVDSLKDLAFDLGKEETGSRVNYAIQAVLADEVEVCVLHHQRKAQPSAAAPKRLEDVYGSRWLTAGMGSVVLLWGDPGDLVVEFRHLKQPADEVGPLTLIHDHERGQTSIESQVDLLDLARIAGEAGLTADRAAVAMFTVESPSRNQVEKARRRLDKLVKNELLTRDGEKPNPVIYRHREHA